MVVFFIGAEEECCSMRAEGAKATPTEYTSTLVD
jgi:hypothetical protein